MPDRFGGTVQNWAIALTSVTRAAGRVLALGLSAALACSVGVFGVAPAAQADEARSEQWQLSALDARDAWKVSTGRGVVVAVIDSGVDATHPDLVGQVLPGIDFVDPDAGDQGMVDPVGHGTTVAALIAGSNRDNSGAEGIAPGAKILPIRVLDKANKYDDPGVVAKAMRWAVDHHASVINLSLGGALRSEAIAEALQYAAAHDVVVVACTGNIATDPTIHQVWYPAREPGVVAVAGLGAVSPRGTETLWSGSLTGPETVLTAPAVNLTGAKPGGGYWVVQGTSFATPLVAGAASLVRARYPKMSAANVINRLIGTAKDLGPMGRDDRFGYGEVDPVAALHDTIGEVDSNPLAEVGPPPVSAVGDADEMHADAAPAEGAESQRPGGAAPMPDGSDQPQEQRLASEARTQLSALAGLTAMLLISVLGAGGVLFHHTRRDRKARRTSQ
ncbi:type VII secretion-associated serine protease mycosin [Dactylosporangium sp. CS-033363]|uniref:type VII secretion-associated serine protease mycosin n=1 Tax=Dactylosporangium sp. CS-033363 TaxID=3239935 RepID=UPI003D9467ED